MTTALAVLEPTTQSKPQKRYALVNAETLKAGKAQPLVHPTTFQEFYDREPNYIFNFLRSKRCPVDLIEDFAQEIYAHLCTPPVSRPDLPDRMGTYVPARMGGYGTRWAWAAYLNRILTNKYIKLIEKNKRSCVNGPHVASLDVTSVEASETPALYVESEDPTRCPGHDAAVTTRLYVQSFLEFLEIKASSECYAFAKALMIFDSPTEAAEEAGISRRKLKGLRDELARWSRCFSRRTLMAA